MAGKATKNARNKSKTKGPRRPSKSGAPAKRPRKPARAKPARAKRAKRTKSRRSKPPAKVASAFQTMIETINETERLRAKNERRDVIDETG